jgi:hypothetical protein
MSESQAVREKRLELQELEATKGLTDPSLYDALHQALVDDLAELGAPVTVTQERPTPRPIRLSSPKKPQTARAREVPEPPAAEAIPAEPKKKINHNGPKVLEPKARLAKMLTKLKDLEAAGKKTDCKRNEIRRHCTTHGLEIPGNCARKPMGNPKWLKPKPEVPTPHQVAAAPPEAAAPRAEVPTAGPAASLRALRSQALDLLPTFEDLDQEAARACREEMDLLAETLVLGGHLISRRSA